MIFGNTFPSISSFMTNWQSESFFLSTETLYTKLKQIVFSIVSKTGESVVMAAGVPLVCMPKMPFRSPVLNTMMRILRI